MLLEKYRCGLGYLKGAAGRLGKGAGVERASKDELSTGLHLGNREGQGEVLLLLLLSLISLSKGHGTSRGNGEAAPQGTSWHLQIKANKPVEHIEEEEGDRENNSRVVI